MLQRMNELAVQSANGTNSATDRKAIQDEVDQLSTEIDRVSETTKFNETYLLKGDTKSKTQASFMKSGYATAGDIFAAGGKTKLTMDKLKKAIANGDKIYTKAEANAGDQTDGDIAKAGKDYAYVTKLYDKDGKQVSAENIANGVNADGKTTADNYYTTDGGKAANDKTPKENIAIEKAAAQNANTGFIQQFDVNAKLSFNLHVGADSDASNKISVNIDSMSAAGIGVKNLKVDTEDDTTAAIDRISEAISKVSSQRSSLGAVQNRLEHTINNLDNVVENTTTAESRIHKPIFHVRTDTEKSRS